MIQAALKLSRVIDAVNDRIGRWSMWLILAMTLLSAGNAVIRKAFDYSSNALLEAQWYMFSAVFLLCAGHALLHNEHIRIDLLSSRYDPRTRAWMELLGTLVFCSRWWAWCCGWACCTFEFTARRRCVGQPWRADFVAGQNAAATGLCPAVAARFVASHQADRFFVRRQPGPGPQGRRISAEQALIDELRRREQAEAAAMQKGAQHG